MTSLNWSSHILINCFVSFHFIPFVRDGCRPIERWSFTLLHFVFFIFLLFFPFPLYFPFASVVCFRFYAHAQPLTYQKCADWSSDAHAHRICVLSMSRSCVWLCVCVWCFWPIYPVASSPSYYICFGESVDDISDEKCVSSISMQMHLHRRAIDQNEMRETRNFRH